MKVKKHVFMFFYLQINVFNIYVSNEKELLTTHYLVWLHLTYYLKVELQMQWILSPNLQHLQRKIRTMSTAKSVETNHIIQ